MKIKLFELATLGFAVVLAGCGEQPYSITSVSTGSTSDIGNLDNGNPDETGTGTNPCPITNTTQNLRILFMVDNSGSTKTTDPQKTHRISTVQTFLNNYGSKTNLAYSYSYFGGTALTYDAVLNQFVASSTTPVGNATQAGGALTLFETLGTASGGTSYGAAFAALNTLVTNDELAAQGEGYVVIFMSDGQPTDIGKSADAQITAITTLTNSLLQVAGSGRLTFSSVFFGNSSDAQSVSNLSTMAKLGGGQFVDTNVTTNLSIDNLITVPTQDCGK